MTVPKGALGFAKETALAAGKIQMRRFRKKHAVTYKAARDIVTNVDRQCEKLIIDAIRKKYPAHGYYAEEGSHSQADYMWVVDPLDGTTNFARGLPCFAVSIALMLEETVLVGVIYDPVLDQMFWARRGRGAYLNGKPMRVSPTKDLAKSVVTTGFPYRQDREANVMYNEFRDVSFKTFAVRRPGAAAIDLAHLAAGFTDAHFEYHLHPWDVAAGCLLVTEAGGRVVLPGDSIYNVYNGRMIASNAKIHTALTNVLGDAR